MNIEPARVGARLVDSLPFSLGGTAERARVLKAAGIDGIVGYLGAMSSARLASILDAGLCFMPVTFAGAYRNGAADELEQLRALGIPQGATVWLDVEAESDEAKARPLINSWARSMSGAGYEPGGYFAPPQPFTSDELWQLSVVRYWQGMGSTRDRFNALAEPRCGWCMTQVFPTQIVGGVPVDYNLVGQDFLGRVPHWVTP